MKLSPSENITNSKENIKLSIKMEIDIVASFLTSYFMEMVHFIARSLDSKEFGNMEKRMA